MWRKPLHTHNLFLPPRPRHTFFTLTLFSLHRCLFLSYFKFACGLNWNQCTLPTSSRPLNDDHHPLLLKFTSYVVDERSVPPLRWTHRSRRLTRRSLPLGDSGWEGVSLTFDDQQLQAQHRKSRSLSFDPTPRQTHRYVSRL